MWETTSAAGWRGYDEAAICAELDTGRPVFGDLTADWCITCKLNERVVIADRRVKAEFDRLDVGTFRPDFTRYDEEIRAELARFGKAGVPLGAVLGVLTLATPLASPSIPPHIVKNGR